MIAKKLIFGDYALKAMLLSLSNNFSLIKIISKREILNRYRGSSAGIFWAFLNPMLMLAIYTFVFSVVFKARWSAEQESKLEFALILFTGLMIFNIFSECINKAPSLIIGNVNYVKKIVFPLEILPVISLLVSLFHFFISLSVWLVFYLIFFGIPTYKILLIPVILLPLVLYVLGASWILAALSVYIRDLNQVVGIFTTMLLFVSPIFFPVSNLPDFYQEIIKFNPLTYIVEQTRNTIIWGGSIDFISWVKNFLCALFFAWAGFVIFKKLQKGFSDVI